MAEPTPQEKNVKEQYESLGRFVEAFEQMVDEVRTWIIILLGVNEYNSGIPHIIAHSPALTAKPLFDILRAMVAVMMVDPNPDPDKKPSKEERECFLGVLSTLAKEYNDLANKRNNLLHGTWLMGIDWYDNEAKTFRLDKFVPSHTGLSGIDLPTTAAELIDLADRCKKCRQMIEVMGRCLNIPGRLWLITDVFVRDGKDYRFG